MKVSENLNPDFWNKFRRWSPGIALGLLTIALMFFFKSKQTGINKIWEKGKGQIASFYTQNLKPLFGETLISNEDIFNFALYRNLPVNKDRAKVLQISAEPSGREYFEILPSSVVKNTNNYDKFINYLELGEEDVDSLNNLLDSYKYDIYASILVKEGGMVAVDPNIIELHKALLADVVRFAQIRNWDKSVKIVPVNYSFVDNPEVDKVIETAKTAEADQFVFCSPDTVFEVKCDFDKKSLVKELRNIDEPDLVKIPPMENIFVALNKPEGRADKYNFNFEYDNNKVKIFPSTTMDEGLGEIKIQNLSEEINNLTFKISSDFIDAGKLSSEVAALVKISTENGSLDVDVNVDDQLQFQFNLDNLGEDLGQLFEDLGNVEEEKWVEFGKKMEKMFSKYESDLEDSASVRELRNAHKSVEELKEEISKMKEEMKGNRKLYKPSRRK